MLEVKEIVNTSNQQEFISKDYMRQRAIYYINSYTIDLMRQTKEKSCLAEMTFNKINGIAHSFQFIEILTKEEANTFVSTVIKCMHDEESTENNIVPYMLPCGCVATRKCMDY